MSHPMLLKTHSAQVVEDCITRALTELYGAPVTAHIASMRWALPSTSDATAVLTGAAPAATCHVELSLSAPLRTDGATAEGDANIPF